MTIPESIVLLAKEYGYIQNIKEAILSLKNASLYLTDELIQSVLEKEWAMVNIFDCKIDNLVYELYGLTEEEIDIVEESLKSSQCFKIKWKGQENTFWDSIR